MIAKEDIQVLMDKRAPLVEQCRGLVTEAHKEGRAMDAAEQEKWDKLDAEVVALTKQIDGLTAQREQDRNLLVAAERNPQAFEAAVEKTPDGRTHERTVELRMNVLRQWALGSRGRELTDEERAEADQMGIQPGNFAGGESTIDLALHGSRDYNERLAIMYEREVRQQGLAAGKGVETTADDRTLIGRLDVALKAFGGMRDPAASTVIRTATGENLPMGQANDTANKAVITAEHGSITQVDIPFTQFTLGAYKYTSHVLASWEILQDSAIDMEGFIGEALGTRIARGTNEHFTVGTGTGQPQGIVTGATAVNVSGGGVDRDKILDLKHAVDPAYRMQDPRFMMNDAVLLLIKKIVHGTGDIRPLWQPSMIVGEPDRIDGDRYIINQDMTTDVTTTTSRYLLYGACRNYWIRDVTTVRLQVLREQFAMNGQVGFIVWSRHDGKLSNAGTDPVKVLTATA